MIASADHTTYELRSVLRQYFFYAFSLQIRSFLEVRYNNLVAHEVTNCPLKQGLLAADLDNIVNQARSLYPINFCINPRTELFIRHVRQYKHVHSDLTFFQEFRADLRRVWCVYNEEFKAFLQADLDCNVILRVDRLYQLVKLAMVSATPGFQLT